MLYFEIHKTTLFDAFFIEKGVQMNTPNDFMGFQALICINGYVVMNPCPCGYYPGSKCRCSDYEIIKYRGKISGPIMDRIDIQKDVRPVDFFGRHESNSQRTSAELRRRVESARKIQQTRYADNEGISCNAQMTTALIQQYCGLDTESLALLRTASEKYGYSARVIHKLLRLARTSADLDGEDKIRYSDIERVLECRDLDKSNSKMMVVTK
jgi:magnesium chelatase family protein